MMPKRKDNRPSSTIHINEFPISEMTPNSKIAVIGKPGCFAKETKVLMYDGTVKNVENIQIGEQVMGDDSKPRNVLELCRGFDDMYDVIPIKGQSYRVNSKHILSLKCTGYNSYKKGDLIDIPVDEYLKKSKTFRTRYKGYRTTAEFSDKEVNFDPYMLGYWLGDGTTGHAQITTIEKEVIAYYDCVLDKYNLELSSCGEYGHNIVCKGEDYHKRGRNFFMKFLRDEELMKRKFVPQHYKCTSKEKRLELLAGYIDADGHYDKHGLAYDLISKSETLLDDMIFIARSLGFSAYKKKCKKSCMYNGKKVTGTYYRCFVSGEGIEKIPVLCERKKASPRKQCKDVLVTGIQLEYIGKDNYYGFILDGNHRFLLDDFTVVHNTGKSSLIADILYNFKHVFPIGEIHSGTEDSNGYYKTIFPSLFIYNDLNINRVKDFVIRQRTAKQQGVRVPWATMILDDCTDEPKILLKKIFQAIFKKGRHWKMLFILSLQYSMDIKPVIRGNIDYTFILRETILSNRDKLWRNYAGAIPNFNDFCDIMDQITDDYTALVINNRTQSNELRDMVFYYKADLDKLKNFKFGCKEFWKWHNDRYDPEYVDPIY
jgi:hypothetical protein